MGQADSCVLFVRPEKVYVAIVGMYIWNGMCRNFHQETKESGISIRKLGRVDESLWQLPRVMKANELSRLVWTDRAMRACNVVEEDSGAPTAR